MGKTGILYDPTTSEIQGIIQVSVNSDLKDNKQDGQEMIEIKDKHSILNEQKNWYIKNGKLERKPQTQIDQGEAEEIAQRAQRTVETKARREAPTNYLLEQLNELRAELGKPPIERADMRKRVKELEKQYGQ